MNNRLLQALTVKPFLFLWLAEIFSQVAMNMMNFILIIVAFNITQSNTAVSGIVLAFTIPAIIFGILAGVYVDRWNKKRVLFFTNLIRGLLMIPLVFLNGDLAALYFITFVVSIFTQFFIPAESPMIPVVVKKELLFAANALFGIGIYGSILIAYALSGPTLVFFGQDNVFLGLALLYLIASFFVLFIKVKNKDVDPKAKISITTPISAKLELKKAFALIYKTKKISHSLFLITLSQVLILIIGVIGPGYAKDILKIQVDQFPLLFVTPAAFGMVIGAVILDHFFHNASKEKIATVGVFLSGIAMLILPHASTIASRGFIQSINGWLPNILDVNSVVVLVVIASLLGFANALVFVPSNTLIQEETSDDLRGKIYGALNSFVGLFSLFPVIIVGGLADIIGVGWVIIGIGMTILSIGFWRLLVK